MGGVWKAENVHLCLLHLAYIPSLAFFFSCLWRTSCGPGNGPVWLLGCYLVELGGIAWAWCRCPKSVYTMIICCVYHLTLLFLLQCSGISMPTKPFPQIVIFILVERQSTPDDYSFTRKVQHQKYRRGIPWFVDSSTQSSRSHDLF